MRKEPIISREAKSSERTNNFDEVVLGYSKDEAFKEAARCLQCKDPTCIAGCPVNIDIKKFIFQVTQNDLAGAYFTIRETNNFPSICGRVCPAEYQCRKACVLNKKAALYASKESINIHFLERFVGDYGIKGRLDVPLAKDKKRSQFKIAVIGSGPAGL